MRLLVLALFAFLTSGCTFIGMGIGAIASKDTTVTTVERGDDVRVTTPAGELKGEVIARNKRSMTMEYNGGCGDFFGTTCPRTKVSFERISLIRKHTSYVGRGALVGGIIDMLCITAAVIGLAIAFSNPDSVSLY